MLKEKSRIIVLLFHMISLSLQISTIENRLTIVLLLTTSWKLKTLRDEKILHHSAALSSNEPNRHG